MAYSLQYYDIVLVCIATSMAFGTVVGLVTAIPLEISVVSLGLVAIGFIGHALFVNGPVDSVDDLAEPVDKEEIPQVLSPLE